MQNDIIKRPPIEPGVRTPQRVTEDGLANETSKPTGVEPKAPQQPIADVINTQSVPSEEPNPAKDEIEPGDKPSKKQNSENSVVTQPDQPKSPAGPGVAIGVAIFTCLILVGFVVYSQMSS